MRLNHKYIKQVARTTAITALIGIIALAAAPCWNDINDSYAAISDNMPEITDKNTDPAEKFAYAGTDYLKKDAYPEINELMSKYYEASLAIDLDTLEGLVSDVTQIDESKLEKQLSYLESIDNIICYTIEGPVEGTFRVYVYYDMKLKGIDTPAPALYAFYITMSSDGNYIVYLSGLDGETQDFISSADVSQDVQTLKALVNERFQNVISSDAKLKEFCEMLDSGMLPSADVSGSALEMEGDEGQDVSSQALDAAPPDLAQPVSPDAGTVLPQ